MKKIFTLLSTIAVLGLLTTSCKGKDPKEVITTITVKSLSVNPASITLEVGESKTVKVDGDVKVSIEPSSASFTLTSSDKAVVSVMGKTIKAEKEGTATITVKAGDKTAKVEVTVAAAKPIDKSRYAGNEIYIPTDVVNFKPLRSEILRAMQTIGWVHQPFESDKEEKNSYNFVRKTGDKKFIQQVEYVHTPSQGSPFIAASSAVEFGKWDELFEKEASDIYGEKFLKGYGFTEYVKRQKIGDKKEISAFVGENTKWQLVAVLYHTVEKVTNAKGETVDGDVVRMEIYKPAQKQNLVPLSL